MRVSRFPILGLLRPGIILGVIGLFLIRPGETRGQDLHFSFQAVPLRLALSEVRSQSGVDIVYARRLVEGRTTTCEYRGAVVQEALGCVLKGSGLRAEPVRRRQYVIVADATHDEREPARGSVAGYVSDRASGEMLPGAHVYLSDLRVGATTNVAGFFLIPSLPMGAYRVRISYLGFQALDTSLVVGASPGTFELTARPLEAAGLVVEDERRTGADISTVPGVLAMPVSDLEQLPSFPGEQDLLHAMQWLPGIHRSGEVSGGLIIRGGEPDQNLYLIDGAPVYHPWHAFSLISTFQTETFKDVRLYRGSFPAEHGGRLAAVLDAQMKDGNRTAPRAVAALSVLSGRIMVESPLGSKGSFMVSARRSYLDKLIGREHPVQDDDGRRDTLRTGYYFYDLSAKYSLRPHPHHQITFSHYQGRDNLDVRLPFDVSLDLSSWRHPADLFFEIDQNWENRLFSVRHQALVSNRSFLTTTAYYSGYDADEGASIRPTMSATLDSEYRVRLYDLGVKMDLDYYLGLSHQLRGGVQVVNHQFGSFLDARVRRSAGAVDSLNQESRLHAWEISGYVQDAWQPSPRWHLSPGLRLAYFSGGKYLHLTPSMSFQRVVRPKRLLLRGGIGTTVQYINRLRDRYSFMYDLVSSRWIPVSDEVKPAWSSQAGLGLEIHPHGRITLSADLYGRYAERVLLPRDEYRTKDGLEGPGIEVGTLLGQYTPSHAMVYGAEVSARVTEGDWSLWLNYVAGRSLNRAPELGERRFRPARFDAPQSFRGVVVRSVNRWAFTFSADVRSGYPYSAPIARYAVGDPLDEEPVPYFYRPSVNNGRLPAYWRMDAAVDYRFRLLGARWRGRLQLYNLFDRRNVISRQYDPREYIPAPADRRSLPLLPLIELEMEI